MKKYLVELIGTFFLVFVIALTGNPLAIGAILMSLVYMGGHISGAHYNPAVTLALWILKKIEARDAMIYMVFQLLGAILAMVIFEFIWGSLKRFVPAPDLSINILKPLFIEAAFTFALVMVILNVAVSKRTSGNSYYGLAIGFTVLALAYAGGSISGGAFNPAVGVGPLIVDAIHGGNNLGHAWIYIAGPFSGAAAAALLFGWLDAEQA